MACYRSYHLHNPLLFMIDFVHEYWLASYCEASRAPGQYSLCLLLTANISAHPYVIEPEPVQLHSARQSGRPPQGVHLVFDRSASTD